jgi:eukaryotic-like serine/threonine-protein kinase
MRFTYQAGAQPLSGYTIQRGIHRGGFGEVYFAHSDGGKEVALKLLHHQDQDVEIRGVTQCLNLKHPNLVNLFDLKTDVQGDRWVVMEYVAGSSLEDVLVSFPNGLPLEEVRDWLSGLVAGVTHLHDRGIVHRDLKPANVYRENGIVKVGDVGLSKRLDSDRRGQHTQSVGTVYYMAPEFARGQYGPEVDVYSLGVMLYELITGKLPFNGETTAEILMKHLTAQPDLMPIPSRLRSTIAKALEKDPRKRTPTAKELERDFLRATEVSTEPLVIPESSFLPQRPVTPHNPSKAGNDPRKETPVDQPFAKFVSLKSGPEVRATDNKSDKSNIVTAVILLLFGISGIGGMFGVVIAAYAFVVLINYSNKLISLFDNSSPWRSFGTMKSLPRSLPAYQDPFSRTPPPHWDEQINRQRTTTTGNPQSKPTSTPTATRRNTSANKSEVVVPLLRKRLPELANSLGTASLVASLLSLAIYVVADLSISLKLLRSAPIMPNLEHAALFAATSVIGTWLLLIGHAVTLGKDWTRRQRWLVRLATGALIGSFAYGMDEFLMITIPPASYTVKSVFSSLGTHPLVVQGVDPTWIGYAWFFAGWLAMRPWSREMDPMRRVRFRMGCVIASVATACMMAWFFKFPHAYAILWAGTVSTTVQLASSWTPRPPLIERR